jgi:hypothetical protein
MRDLIKINKNQLLGPEYCYMVRLAAIWTAIGCGKSEMRAEFWMDNPKWFLKSERER